MDNFANIWANIMIVLSSICALISIGIIIAYFVKRIGLKDDKEKYDFFSREEEKYFKYAIYALGAAVFFILNIILQENLKKSFWWLFTRIGVSIPVVVLITYIPTLLLKYVYPSGLNKRLRNLRYRTRKSPEGNNMRLLSEEEEDVHLDEGMIAEENVFSVDYDVWIDDITGFTKIEKYPGHLEAQTCDRCNLQTLKIEKEEIVKAPTEEEDGELLKHFKCSYCKRIRRRPVRIVKLGESDDQYIAEHIEFDARSLPPIEAVRIEVFRDKNEAKSFSFQSIEQARDFLQEFDEQAKYTTEE